MFALRHFAIGSLMLILAACSTDKMQSPPPKEQSKRKPSAVNANLVSSDKRTPLHLARSAAMIDFLSQFTSPWSRDADGKTPFLYMLTYKKTGSESELPWLAMLKKTCEYGGLLPLFFNTESPINAADFTGRAPLHYAAKLGNLVALNAILDCPGSNLFVRDLRGRTALHAAAASPHGSTAGANALLTAARHRVISLAAFINAQDRNGDTALHIAQRCGNKALYELLIYFGARADLRNRNGLRAEEQKSHECSEN
jgi:ankyrin repeat protein